MHLMETNREPPEGKEQNDGNRHMQQIMKEHRSTFQRCQETMDSRQKHPSSGNERSETQEEAPPRFSYTFPIFTGQRLFMYRRYNRKLVNLWASIPLTLVMFVDFVFHYNLSRTSSSPLFVISVALACVGYVANAVHLAPYILGNFSRFKALTRTLENFVEQLPFYVGDVVNCTATLSLGFNLVARVLAGTCLLHATCSSPFPFLSNLLISRGDCLIWFVSSLNTILFLLMKSHISLPLSPTSPSNN